MVDIVESEDLKEVEKAAVIIRGHSTAETVRATPSKDFLAALRGNRSDAPAVLRPTQVRA